MNQHYRNLIALEFQNCVNKTIERISSMESTYRPFHSALLSDEVLLWSSFERSFSTSFGQRVIEEIARLVVLSNGADDAQRQKSTLVLIDESYNNAIYQHTQNLRDGLVSDISWQKSLSSILSVNPSGKLNQKRVISDLWWVKNGTDNYISLKTVKPNIDQASIAKEDCLHLKIYDRNCNVFFGLPYNPYGDDRHCYAFTPPMRIFDFKHDPVVLIGRDLWDYLGGSGCYDELISIALEVGEDTKLAIKNLL